MITIRKSEERGHADHGWLKSHHSFSFANYYDPEHMGFSVLRVINEDRVAPGNGFGTHPHRDMEIISYVVSGELAHKDSMGNGEVIKAGEFQVITAGTGVTHSEFNPSDENEVHFLQIWITPEKSGLPPSYDQKSFDTAQGLTLVAGKEAQLKINQDAMLYLGRMASGDKVELPLSSKRKGWLQMIKGSAKLQGTELGAGDGASLSETNNPEIIIKSDSEFLFFNIP